MKISEIREQLGVGLADGGITIRLVECVKCLADAMEDGAKVKDELARRIDGAYRRIDEGITSYNDTLSADRVNTNDRLNSHSAHIAQLERDIQMLLRLVKEHGRAMGGLNAAIENLKKVQPAAFELKQTTSPPHGMTQPISMPVLCPVCHGPGHVYAGFYTGTPPVMTSGGPMINTCRACGGSGVVR